MPQTAIIKQDPLITVITLSYNSEHLLESIQSVLDQTYEKIQYIIVDDGSRSFKKQKVIDYLESHKKGNIQEYIVFVNNENLGTVKSFNLALRQSRGSYIFNLAADDLFYDSDILKDWVKEFVRRNSIFMAGQMAVYSSDLMHFKEILPHPKESQLLKEGNLEKIFEAMTKKNFVIGCSTARSRIALEQYGYFDEAYFLLEDYPYALRLLRKKIPIDYWDRPVVKYRQGGVSSPQNFNKLYEHDSDLNFKKEILPYTKHPIRARIWYQYWKFDRQERGKFTSQYQHIQDTKKFYLVPFLCLRYPIPVLRGIKNRLIKIIKR